jgi:hypothetical protein
VLAKTPIMAAVLLLLGSAPVAAGVCVRDQIAREAARARMAQHDLMAIPIADATQADVSPTASRAIVAMKDRLNAFVSATVRCAPAFPQASRLKTELASFDGVRDIAKRPSSDEGYGAGLDFTVEIPRSPAGLLAITARFGIACGEDAMLMIFERRMNGWYEVLRSQSAPYKSVAGGWWSFDYAISPPDAAGKWFVVAKNIAPWCSSTWSEIRYAVLRPSASAAEPRRIFAKADSIWWGSERFGEIKIGVQDFDLRFRAESMDDGVHNREWIRRYSVIGDAVRRIAPLAASPRDFADEWIASSWSEAAPWTSPAASVRLERVHDQLHGLRFLDYVSQRGCSDGTDRVQIEVEPTDPKHGTAHYYFLIAGRADYTMIDVAREANRACSRPDHIDPPIPR